MMNWVRTRSPLVRTLVYAALAILAFALAAGVGALSALIVRGDLTGSLERQEPRSADEQAVGRARQKDGAAEREEAAAEQKEAAEQDQAAANNRSTDAAQRAEGEYVDAVEDIQTNAVVTFRNSHEKLLRYDSLSAADVEETKANEAVLQDMDERADNLDPPEKYDEQHEVFASAIDQLHEAARLAHVMTADPVAAAELGFDEYDGRVNEASALLRRSNEMLGEDYEAIGGVREVSPEL
jgi:cytoskeletal protein RodZ